jgi:glycosyltransferase involved in cell wall biosynthesis
MNDPQKLRILVVGNYRPDDQRSMLGYESMFLEEMSARNIALKAVHPIPTLLKGHQRRSGIGKFLGYFDKFIIFQLRLWFLAGKSDVVFIIDHSNAMYVPRRRRGKYIIICHDVYAIRCALGLEPPIKIRLTGRIFQHLILRGIKRADKILCVSEFTRSQLKELAPEVAARAELARSALRFCFRPVTPEDANPIIFKSGLSWRKYFLNVGCIERRKNRKYLAEVFAELLKLTDFEDFRLVIVGHSLEADYPGLMAELGITNSVTFLTRVDDNELMSLYSGAKGLIFPSNFEGFGWPVIEAQACGCPTFTADLPPMNENGGSPNSVIPLDNASEAATTIRDRLCSSSIAEPELLLNASQFSREAMVSAWIRELTPY